MDILLSVLISKLIAHWSEEREENQNKYLFQDTVFVYHAVPLLLEGF